jgi:FKBP-type peptidyl-prolyl cis-trans isomerase FklB
MKLRLLALALAIALSSAWVIAQESLPGPGAAQDAAAPKTDARHYSYAIGLDIGTSFRNDEVELDVESLLAGLKDGLAKADPKYSQELCQLALERLSAEREQKMRQAAEGNRQPNLDYLAKNAKAEGVQTTKSGLQYKVLNQGNGASPTARDTVVVHYRGQLIDGTEFDSSLGGEPARLPVGRVIQGWSEALQLMSVGDKWQLVIPAELGYGEQGAGGVIPPHATLIFEVELLGIEGQ